LVDWIFDRIHLEAGSRVLELCSGTGNQTKRMIELVGDQGFVVATDISEKALDQWKGKTDLRVRARFTTVAASMDDLQPALEESALGDPPFDMVFCAYGLYYSKNPERVLEESLKRIGVDGRIIIVGPFGPNNGQLFDFLESSGVKIADYIRYTSQDFMESVVIPFACHHFAKNTIHTLVNPVYWKNADDVMHYWSNSTFFDEQKMGEVECNIKNHFQLHSSFTNEKWIMMVEMCNCISS